MNRIKNLISEHRNLFTCYKKKQLPPKHSLSADAKHRTRTHVQMPANKHDPTTLEKGPSTHADTRGGGKFWDPARPKIMWKLCDIMRYYATLCKNGDIFPTPDHQDLRPLPKRNQRRKVRSLAIRTPIHSK